MTRRRSRPAGSAGPEPQAETAKNALNDFAAAARTSVAAARIGTPTTYARQPSGQHTVAAVRVGTPPVLLHQGAGGNAEPDPRALHTPAVLARLNDAHADALAACLRAVGHPAELPYAVGLDSGGLSVASGTATGVHLVRLACPSPVTGLSQLPTSPSLVLRPQCGCSRPQPGQCAAGDQQPDS